jgi:Zn-dependent protease
MNKYYKLDSRKLTYGEYWNIVRSVTVIVPWMAKLLNIPMKFISGLPSFESVRKLEVPESEFSARAREKLQPLLEKCRQMGFHSPRFFTYESMRRDVRTSFIALLHPSGATVRLMHSLGLKSQPPKEKLLVVLLSELRDGTFFFTSSQRKQFLSAPGIVANRLVGASLERLLESHLQKLKELPMSNPRKAVTSVEMLDDVWDRYERKSREFGLQRGIYVWMTPEEVASEEGNLAEARAMSGGTEQNMDVLLEINQMRNRKSGWGGILILFIVSLVLFIGAGARSWSWDYLVILLGVLFVHELGHYLAMRAFNYRNVRMFFIPFFGAAVSGQHYNVAGWKKVVVSLMGPLPGIALGVIIGAAGAVAHKTLLVKIAVVSLLINGSNLLPVLPLDGGWVFHTLLFSRHYVFDTVFRVVAALVLISSATFLRTKILMYLGILMLIGIPTAYRVARIAADLKKRELPPVSEDDQNIPPATAQTIIDEVKHAAARPQATKIVAQQALQIFETLNARPPGWAATMGLLFVHVTSFAVAAVFALVFIIAQRGELQDLFANASMIPKHKLAVEPWPAWNGSQAVVAPDAITMVATFATASAAAAQFQELTNRLPATASLQLFGESVLLSLPAGREDLRKQWLDDFQGRTKDVFVDSTNYHAAFSLFCIAPDTNTAQTIVSELNGYFTTLPEAALVPPWQPNDSRPPVERARNELARQTYTKLRQMQMESYEDAGLPGLETKLDTARTQGDQSAVTALRGQIKSMMDNLAKQNLERVRSGAEGLVDTNVVDLFIPLNENGAATNWVASDESRRALAQLMGQLPLVNGRADPADERFAARYGMATSKRLLVNVTFVSFHRIVDGPQALANWLYVKRCIGFRYDFQAGMAADDVESN